MSFDYYIHDWTNGRVPSIRLVLMQQAFNGRDRCEVLRELCAHLRRTLRDAEMDIVGFGPSSSRIASAARLVVETGGTEPTIQPLERVMRECGDASSTKDNESGGSWGEGRQSERAEVVAWLRRQLPNDYSCWSEEQQTMAMLADAIDCGAHTE